MPITVQVDNVHPVLVVPEKTGEPQIVKNIGSAVFYSQLPTVKATGTTIGTELVNAAETTIEVPSGLYFLAVANTSTLELKSPPPSGEIGTTEIANEAVTAAKLAKEAVTEAKYAKESLPATGVKLATLPAVAAEKTVKVGVAGVDRAILANYTGDGTAGQSFKVKHNLETFGVSVTVYTNVASKPGVQVTGAAVPEITATNAKELTVKYPSTEPLAGTTVWIKVEA